VYSEEGDGRRHNGTALCPHSVLFQTKPHCTHTHCLLYTKPRNGTGTAYIGYVSLAVHDDSVQPTHYRRAWWLSVSQCTTRTRVRLAVSP
jgi:hypothetical protein